MRKPSGVIMYTAIEVEVEASEAPGGLSRLVQIVLLVYLSPVILLVFAIGLSAMPFAALRKTWVRPTIVPPGILTGVAELNPGDNIRTTGSNLRFGGWKAREGSAPARPNSPIPRRKSAPVDGRGRISS